MNDNDYDAEFREHVSHVIEVYKWEQARDLPATQDWFAVISNTAILARMLKDENEDSAIDTMLSTAITVFDAAIAEMGEYLQTPALPAAITEFDATVQTAIDSIR